MSNSSDTATPHRDESPEVHQLQIKQKVTPSAGNPSQKKKMSKRRWNKRKKKGKKENQKEDETQSVDLGGETIDDQTETQPTEVLVKVDETDSWSKVLSKSKKKRLKKMERERCPKVSRKAVKITPFLKDSAHSKARR